MSPASQKASSVLDFAYSAKAAELIRATILEVGDEKPFFATTQVNKALDLVRLRPSKEFLKKHGLDDDAKAPTELFAAMYRHDGKTLLLLRIATYTVPDYKERLAWIKAVLDEFGRFADVLVIDQTHNPGGQLLYAEGLASIFADRQMRGLVNFLHADRMWLNTFAEVLSGPEKKGELRRIWELGYRLVEEAYDAGLSLTRYPISVGDTPEFIAPASFVWTKPVLVLTDELAGSCGDIFPLLMKGNGRAKLFGKRTIGLGGNVEEVVRLPSSQAVVRLTRGHFVLYRPDGEYDLDDLVENNGVTPDIEYSHTIEDFRAGYVGYAKKFSDAAVELTKAP